ncbi:unnamed protein product [Ectocarpus sp. 4 AP-2014]
MPNKGRPPGLFAAENTLIAFFLCCKEGKRTSAMYILYVYLAACCAIKIGPGIFNCWTLSTHAHEHSLLSSLFINFAFSVFRARMKRCALRTAVGPPTTYST